MTAQIGTEHSRAIDRKMLTASEVTGVHEVERIQKREGQAVRSMLAMVALIMLVWTSLVVCGCGPQLKPYVLTHTSQTYVSVADVSYLVEPYTQAVDYTQGYGTDLWDTKQNTVFLLRVTNHSIEKASIQASLATLVDSLGGQYNIVPPKLESIWSQTAFSQALLQALFYSPLEQAIAQASGRNRAEMSDILATFNNRVMFKDGYIYPGATIHGVLTFARLREGVTHVTLYLPNVLGPEGPVTLTWEFDVTFLD